MPGYERGFRSLTDEREDAGAVIATALDAEAERTVVLVLNGTTFTECARIELPHGVPFGFHGEYFAEV